MALVRQKNTFGELITLDQACELTSLGKTKVRQLQMQIVIFRTKQKQEIQ